MKNDPGGDAAAQLGDREIRVDGDVMFIRIRGALGRREMEVILDLGDSIVATYGYMMILADGGPTTSIDPEARKLQSERLKKVIHPSHTAIYGASTVARLTSNLVQRGIEILTGKTYPISFHADEAEARGAIAAKRVVLQKGSGPASRRS